MLLASIFIFFMLLFTCVGATLCLSAANNRENYLNVIEFLVDVGIGSLIFAVGMSGLIGWWS